MLNKQDLFYFFHMALKNKIVSDEKLFRNEIKKATTQAKIFNVNQRTSI
jgi:hypothetical protein